ncbi:MAG: NAD(+) synthase [Acidaminococcaceae bacterium]
MTVRFACAQIEVIPGRPDINFATIIGAIEKAKSENIDILVLPELAVPGYFLGDLWEQPAFLDDCREYGNQIIAATDNICVVFGNIALDENKHNEDGRIRKYNAAFIAQDGKLLKGALPYPFIVKASLPNYREFDDSRYFHSLRKLQEELSIPIEELVKPINISIRNQSFNLGIMLCEDGWTTNYLINIPELLAKNGADILCNISCSPFSLQKNPKRHQIFGGQAKEYHLPLLYCNNVGVQNNGKNIFTFDGCSCAYQNDGKLLSDSPAYEEHFLKTSFNPENKLFTSENNIHNHYSEIAEIYNAISYGTRKFLNQINIKKMTIGVSGGIDSALTAAFYVNLLGPENVLLVNMPSRYNSPLTKNLALMIAQALKCNYCIIPIQESVDHTNEQLTQAQIHNYATNTTFSLELSTLARENIQARDRTRILAAIASVFGGGFSCNSNKAEITVGYATFYGDLTGVLAMIGDLWKNQVYELAHYLNDKIFERKVIPDDVFTISPSAELSAEQTVGVGGDPMVYDYHDYLFRAFIERWDKASPRDILYWYKEKTLEEVIGCQKGIVAKIFPTNKSFIDDLERWWKLFSGFAVAKRIQAPPIISLSRRAYGYDHREAQLSPYFSIEYYRLKDELLKD